MDTFVSHSGVAAPIDIPNCDTDQIIPARFLRRPVDDPDYASFFLADLRFNSDGSKKDFVLNRPGFKSASILVADRNWGCGSSRENAVTALLKNGIRVVIAPSFGDIHYNNCAKRGVLAARLSEQECAGLREILHQNPGIELSVDLETQIVRGPGNSSYKFAIDPAAKTRLLSGLDDIDLTLRYQTQIAAFESKREDDMDWLS